jgi:hypothetical protein
MYRLARIRPQIAIFTVINIFPPSNVLMDGENALWQVFSSNGSTNVVIIPQSVRPRNARTNNCISDSLRSVHLDHLAETHLPQNSAAINRLIEAHVFDWSPIA